LIRSGKKGLTANVWAASAWILLFFLFFCWPVNIEVSADITTVSVNPQSNRVWGTGAVFAVDVVVSNVANLYGWQFTLYYDSSLLNGTSITEGSFLKSGGNTELLVSSLNDSYEATHGSATAVCTLLGNVPGVNGGGTLATIKFTTKTLGNCLLTFSKTKLGDPQGTNITHEVSNGAVEVVQAVHDVAVRNVALSSSEIAESRSLEVYVLVANEGNYSEDFNVNLYANNSLVTTEPIMYLTAGTQTNAILEWNTTGAVVNSSYQISAEATQVTGETNLDNNVYVDGFVLITPRHHDVAVERVAPQRTTIFGGQSVNVTVGVVNNGDYYETFNVTLYYNNTVVSTKSVASLAYGGQRDLNFVWDTTGVGSNRSYVIKAVASQVPGETDVLNNTLVDGTITVLPVEALFINVTRILPCDQNGQPINTFTEGTIAYLKITVSSNSINPEALLLTVNTYDFAANTIGVISFEGPTAPGETTFLLGSPIPIGVRIGTATVYVNALTNWPQSGGVPYSPERSTTFQITGR
jgi:hypothetical protein